MRSQLGEHGNRPDATDRLGLPNADLLGADIAPEQRTSLADTNAGPAKQVDQQPLLLVHLSRQHGLILVRPEPVVRPSNADRIIDLTHRVLLDEIEALHECVPSSHRTEDVPHRLRSRWSATASEKVHFPLGEEAEFDLLSSD